MAKVTIIFEDQGNDRVSVTSFFEPELDQTDPDAEATNAQLLALDLLETALEAGDPADKPD